MVIYTARFDIARFDQSRFDDLEGELTSKPEILNEIPSFKLSSD